MRLDIFSDFVQSERRSRSIEQKSLKMKLNLGMAVKERFQYLMKYPKINGW